ncbi:hypothetical protein dqs_2004 [Azoarcus olearius]|uniref:type II toxin-antitoxin system death-on-curing family toxin n=1 Tax=Azoarcus sp. (strain BH72) TaxID=418699 RepID=UPI0008062E1A|nr:type II toxin-antitoxin system death-on-curing family toxin [Azoarcus olearius]ANQ85042.1 hypothetical protein dqs_2004 [Azoarcus olearius]
MWLPDTDAVISVHEGLVQLFVDEADPISPAGVKSQGMLESACSRPHTGLGSVQKYETLEAKLAALFHSLTKNHPFHNGNKRTALVSLLTALHRNDRRLNTSVTDDQIFDFVVAVTADQFPTHEHDLDADDVVSEIAVWIRKFSVSTVSAVPTMKTRHFLEKCTAAGAAVKPSKGGSHVISHAGASIRISKSTRQLSGPAIKQYLRKLHLNESQSGISTDEFQDGASDEKAQIYRFIAALKRLAKT